MKRAIYTITVVASLIFSGCGDDSWSDLNDTNDTLVFLSPPSEALTSIETKDDAIKADAITLQIQDMREFLNSMAILVNDTDPEQFSEDCSRGGTKHLSISGDIKTVTFDKCESLIEGTLNGTMIVKPDDSNYSRITGSAANHVVLENFSYEGWIDGISLTTTNLDVYFFHYLDRDSSEAIKGVLINTVTMTHQFDKFINDDAMTIQYNFNEFSIQTLSGFGSDDEQKVSLNGNLSMNGSCGEGNYYFEADELKTYVGDEYLIGDTYINNVLFETRDQSGDTFVSLDSGEVTVSIWDIKDNCKDQ